MRVRLLESAHDTWAPAGTVGELEDKGGAVYLFTPETNPDRHVWIGRVKWEEVGETVVEKPRRKRQ